MWPFSKKMEVKFCDCGTDFCWKPEHMRQLPREKPGVIITANNPMVIERAKREAERRLRREKPWGK